MNTERLSAVELAQQLSLLANNVPVLMAIFDVATFQCRFANQQYARAFGWTEQTVLGAAVEEVIGEAAIKEIQPHIDKALQQKKTASYERTMIDAQQQPMVIEVTLVPYLDDAGAAVSVFVLIADITRHRMAERELRDSEERLEKFMEASAEGIVFHQNGRITDVNAVLYTLVGRCEDEVLGHSPLEFVASDALERARAVMESGLETSFESAIMHRDGVRIPVELIARSMVRHGQTLRMVIVRDLRDRVAAQARIFHLAHHDSLTSLPNRMSFMGQLQVALGDARAHGLELAVLFIDLDNFKRVNDSLGHEAGDALLRTVAERLGSRLRGTDRVARFGGDEFVVLLRPMPSRETALSIAHQIVGVIEAPIDLNGRSISISPSIGISVFPSDGQSGEELIQHADTAMYLAKAQGRAGVEFFRPSMAANAYAELVLESQLSTAIERKEFVLHFQPQVKASDGSLTGVEALIRWNHPERGLLGPNEFIGLAEQRRLMLLAAAAAVIFALAVATIALVFVRSQGEPSKPPAAPVSRWRRRRGSSV